jgi:Fe-S-cluster containining protein
MTQHIFQDTQDIRYYMSLHNVETKPDGRGGLYLKMPVQCTALDPKTLRCTLHDSRPDVCKRYPQAESPFIPKEKCSMLP